LWGFASHWALTHYGAKVLSSDWSPGFSVKNQRKDFGYCETAAEQLAMEIPMTTLVNSLLKRLQDQGRGEETTAALFEVYVGRELLEQE
jgi:3-hydroxyisobutyrate dehydrogenase